MIYKNDCTLPTEYLKQLTEQGLDSLPDMIRVMVNEAMRIERENYLGAKPYERSEQRQGHANGYKPKTVRTRVGEVTFDIPQVREGGFYPHALEKGMRSERALLLTLAEMYVQGRPSLRDCAAPRSAPARSAGHVSNWTKSWKPGGPDPWEKCPIYTWTRVMRKCGRRAMCGMQPF